MQSLERAGEVTQGAEMYLKSVMHLQLFICSQCVLRLCAPLAVEPLDVTSSPRSQVHRPSSPHPFPFQTSPLCSPSADLSLIPEENERHEGLKPLTFCLLPLLLLLPQLTSFLPHLISVVSCTRAQVHTHIPPCTICLRFPVPAPRQRLVLHLCGQQKGLRRAWLAGVTLQQYRDAFILFPHSRVTETQSIQSRFRSTAAISLSEVTGQGSEGQHCESRRELTGDHSGCFGRSTIGHVFALLEI